MSARPVVTRVSHATRPSGSSFRIASRIASEIWSAILSGWPSVTDSDVKRLRVLPMVLRSKAALRRSAEFSRAGDLSRAKNQETRRAVAPAVRRREPGRAKDHVVSTLVKEPASRSHERDQKLEVGFGIFFERGVVKDHVEQRKGAFARWPSPLFPLRRITG